LFLYNINNYFPKKLKPAQIHPIPHIFAFRTNHAKDHDYRNPRHYFQIATINVSAPGIPAYDKKTDVRLSDRGGNGRDRREMETAHPLEDQGRPAPFRGNPGKTAGDLPENAHPPAQGP
jgi:hypothetical protein